MARIQFPTKALLLCFLLLVSLTVRTQTPCVNGFAGEYPCSQVDLLSFIPLSQLGGGENTNDIWGWVSPQTGREYAVVGCSNGTAFVDISNPVLPVFLGLLPTHTVNSLWRDVEVFRDHCFVVSEAPGHGLQVMDMTQLDQVVNPPVTFGEDAHYGGFGNSHTLNIDPESGWLLAMGTNTFDGGPHILDVSTPLNPVFLGGFPDDGYTHDGFVHTYRGPDEDKRNKVIAVLCNRDALTIADITNPQDCQLIDLIEYDQMGYVHQGWFTRDFRYFLVNDELDELEYNVGTRTHMFDLSNLDEIKYMGFHQFENTAIDHNLYVLDQLVYESNYRSGLRILDAIDVADGKLKEVGYFDFIPENDNMQFSGTWSNYPYLPSGVNLATSMYEGVFITRQNILRLEENTFDLCDEDEIVFNLICGADLSYPLQLHLPDIPGNPLLSPASITGPGEYFISIENPGSLPCGNYDANLVLSNSSGRTYHLPVYFTHFSETAPSFHLLEPEHKSVLESGSQIQFVWESVSGAASYVFQLARDPEFISVISEHFTSAPIWTEPSTLPEGTYYWRAMAFTGAGNSL